MQTNNGGMLLSPTYFDLYQEKYGVCERRTNFQAKHPISNLTFNNVLNANFPKHTYLLGCNVETKISSPRRDMRRKENVLRIVPPSYWPWYEKIYHIFKGMMKIDGLFQGVKV
jgi:hypothetical protein